MVQHWIRKVMTSTKPTLRQLQSYLDFGHMRQRGQHNTLAWYASKMPPMRNGARRLQYTCSPARAPPIRRPPMGSLIREAPCKRPPLRGFLYVPSLKRKASTRGLLCELLCERPPSQRDCPLEASDWRPAAHPVWESAKGDGETRFKSDTERVTNLFHRFYICSKKQRKHKF